MGWWSGGVADAARWRRWLCCLAVVAWLALPAMPGRAGETPAAPPPGAAAPTMDNAMRSAGLLQQVLVRLEDEASSDIGMLPETPGTVLHEWRSFDHNRSSLGALVNLGWVTLAGCLALAAERLVARGFSRHRRRLMQTRRGGPTVTGLFLLLLCDILGLAVFAGVFVYSRHWLSRVGVTMALIIFAANVLVRWRVAAVIINVMLRPGNAPARLIELPDEEAHRLARFLSATILAVIVLVGFGRYGLKDVDSGAPHVVALIVAAAVCALYALIVLRARAAAEALIRGAGGGLVGALRAAIARAWLAIGLIAVAGLFLFFVFGLSLGLLSYYHAVVSTLGVWLVLLVLERLAEKGWRHHEDEPAGDDRPEAMERLVARAAQHILAAAVLIGAATILTSIWIKAIHLPAATASRAMYSGVTAFAILFVAYLVWELLRLAIDRHLQDVSRGPRLPGGDHDGEAAPGSRLQTILPILRIAFGAVIAVIAALTVLSHLGVDTAPLIAGAGVFGLAISFGAQSLVRDIISGLFYIWDDAFRVGEYIDTGRLKGTVEALGIRSIKLRHHNGPLHTIPYGQLGAVTNQSRDFATIKFNLRLEPRSDLELVRRTAKRIGLDMQAQPEIAAEVMLPLKMQGIAEVADTAVVVRFKFTARPVKPSWVQREYLKRMYQVFAEKGIVFASGTLMLQTVAPSPEGPARGAALVPLAGGRAEEPAAMMRPAAAQTQPA